MEEIMPGQVNLPRTLQRSSRKAQRTYAEVLKNAEEQYGSGERAARTAYAALKHSFEKVGDHWVEKQHPGPSDSRSRQSTADKRRGKGETFGGVDVDGNSRRELYARAQALDIPGRSRMTKEELARAISRKQG
jgi:ChaB protein